MKPDGDKDFENNMGQLVNLLKKMMKSLPSQAGGAPFKQFPSKDPSINVNICLFSFLPMSPEELEEWEDLYDQYMSGVDPHSDNSSEMTMDLNASDLDFLKKHGLRFND